MYQYPDCSTWDNNKFAVLRIKFEKHQNCHIHEPTITLLNTHHNFAIQKLPYIL